MALKFFTREIDGRKIRYISDDLYHYSFGYYSNNSWVDQNRIVVARGTQKDTEGFESNNDLVLIDLEQETETFLSEKNGGYVVHGTNLYYMKKLGDGRKTLYCRNLDTGEHKELYTGERITFPHMTADGRYLNWEVFPVDKNGLYACERFDTVTGEVVRLFEKNFAVPFPVCNHMMINPQNPNQVFFSHEGITYYITNRLWLYDKDRGVFPLAKQRLDVQGNLGDCFGHECWAPDGKGLYFIKYPCSPTPPRGICYVDTNCNQTDVLYGKYPYWHVSCAPDGRYLAADTDSGRFSGVCLIDTATNTEIMAVKATTTWSHPCHPHPHFSPDSSLLAFHDLIDENVSIGFLPVAEVFPK